MTVKICSFHFILFLSYELIIYFFYLIYSSSYLSLQVRSRFYDRYISLPLEGPFQASNSRNEAKPDQWYTFIYFLISFEEGFEHSQQKFSPKINSRQGVGLAILMDSKGINIIKLNW